MKEKKKNEKSCYYKDYEERNLDRIPMYENIWKLQREKNIVYRSLIQFLPPINNTYFQAQMKATK